MQAPPHRKFNWDPKWDSSEIPAGIPLESGEIPPGEDDENPGGIPANPSCNLTIIPAGIQRRPSGMF